MSPQPTPIITNKHQLVTQRITAGNTFATDISSELNFAEAHLIPVCHYIDFHDIIALRQVNKQWRAVCQQPTAWIYIELTLSTHVGGFATSDNRRNHVSIDFDALKQVPTNALRLLPTLVATAGPYRNQGEQMCREFHRIAPNTVSLLLNTALQRYQPEVYLQCLNLFQFVQQSVNAYCIPTELPNIRCISIDVRQYNKLTVLSPTVQCITIHWADAVHGFRLIGVRPVTRIDPPAVTLHKFETLPNLLHLQVDIFRIVECMQHMSYAFASNLLTLRITLVNNDLLRSIAVNCLRLESLCITGHDSVWIDNNIMSLQHARFINTLRNLHLDCIKLTTDSIPSITQFQHLQYVRLSRTLLTDQDLHSICAQLPQLYHLQVIYNTQCHHTVQQLMSHIITTLNKLLSVTPKLSVLVVGISVEPPDPTTFYHSEFYFFNQIFTQYRHLNECIVVGQYGSATLSIYRRSDTTCCIVKRTHQQKTWGTHTHTPTCNAGTINLNLQSIQYYDQLPHHIYYKQQEHYNGDAGDLAC